MIGLLAICLLSLLGTCLGQMDCPVTGLTYPDPDNCHNYNQCEADGFLHIYPCSPVTYNYDFRTQTCVADPTVCEGFKCPPAVVDDYLYDIEACEFYIQCYMGTASLRACPVGLYFNPISKMCVQPELSGCGEYASTTTPFTTPDDSTCRNNPPGSIMLLPYPGDCSKYIECTGNERVDYNCPTGLYFDASRNMCNYPELVNPPCEGTTQGTPITTIIPGCVPGFTGFIPDPVDCSKYYYCNNGIAYPGVCPPGLLFDVVLEICITASSATCFFTTPSTPTTPTQNPPNPSCANEPNGKTFPYPGFCHLYLMCLNGELLVEECPEGLYYNAMLEVCDYPYEAHCPWATD